MAADRKEGDRLPKLLAFDLDGTLWYPEMYQMWGGGAPFRFVEDHVLHDRRGRKFSLLGDSFDIFKMLKSDPTWKDVEIAYVSTCDEPEWAAEALTKFRIHSSTLGECGEYHHIYKARNKQVHFHRIAKESGIDFADMIFFDNQTDNIHYVSQLGVHSVYVPEGLTNKAFQKAIKDWRRLQTTNEETRN